MTLKERRKLAIKEQKSAPHGILSPIFRAYQRAKSIIEQDQEEHRISDCIVVDFRQHKVYWLSSISAVNVYNDDYSIVRDMIEEDENPSARKKELITEFEKTNHEHFYLNDAEIDKVMFLLGPDMEVAMHFSHEYQDDFEYLWDVMYCDYLKLLESCYKDTYKGLDTENQLLCFSYKFFENQE